MNEFNKLVTEIIELLETRLEANHNYIGSLMSTMKLGGSLDECAESAKSLALGIQDTYAEMKQTSQELVFWRSLLRAVEGQENKDKALKTFIAARSKWILDNVSDCLDPNYPHNARLKADSKILNSYELRKVMVSL